MPSKERVIRIEGRIEWKIDSTESGPWVGFCDALKLTAQADTWGELMQDIEWAMGSVFEDLLETGDLERFLEERGWGATIPENHRKLKKVTFDVPFLPHMIGDEGQQKAIPF